MKNLITSFVFASLAVVAMSVSAHAGGDQRTCAPKPAINIGMGLTWTFDSQPGTCGYNLKPLGSTEPVRYQGCVLRRGGTGGVFSCKIAANAPVVSNVGGKESLVLETSRGKLIVTKGSFGYSVKKF